MTEALDNLIYLFGLMALGYGLGALRILKPETGDGLADFVFVVAIPVMLMKTLATADLPGGLAWQLWGAYFPAVAVAWVIGQTIIRRL